MINEDSIDELLDRWECERNNGRSVSLDELCRGNPELRPPLEKAIADLRRVDGFLLATGDWNQDSIETVVDPAGAELAKTLGDYQVLNKLAEGGMGVVFKARHRELDRIVALKTIRDDRIGGQEAARRFEVEAQSAAKLSHANIAAVFEVGSYAQPDGSAGRFIAMEFVDGTNLRELVNADGPQGSRDAAELLREVANAVHFAHSHGVIHRDIKPSNILIDQRGRPKIADFGIAKQLDDASELTVTGAILGTPSYMPPEQAGGEGRNVVETSDVYSLGATLYFQLTGRPPFRAATAVSTIRQVIENDPVPPRVLNPEVDRELETICLKCLEKQQSRRYASAAELEEDLRRYLANEPISAVRPSVWYRFRKFAARRKTLVGGIAATTLALLIGLVGVSYALGRARLFESKAEQSERERDAATANAFYQRGDWKNAIVYYDRAIAAGHPKAKHMRLRRAKVLLSMHKTKQATTELETLLNETDGELKASVLLALGDAELGANSKKALERIREAKRVGLPTKAERHYAEAMLTDSLTRTASELKLVLGEEPAHLRAHQIRVMSLLFLGRRREMREQTAAAKALFPKDFNFGLAEAIGLAVEGKLDAALRVIDGTGEYWSKEQNEAARFIVKFFYEARDVEGWMLNAAAAQKLSTFAIQGFKHLQAIFGQKGNIVLPPAIDRIFSPLLNNPVAMMSFFSSTQSKDGKLVKLLIDTKNPEPEGTRLFLRGLALVTRRRFADASRAFEKAINNPSMLDVQRPALLYLVRCQIERLRRADPKPQADLRRKAGQTLRRLFDLYRRDEDNGNPVLNKQALFLAELAMAAKQRRLAFEITGEWVRRYPDNIDAVQSHGYTSHYNGANALAVKLLKKAVASNPLPFSKRILKQAQGQILELARIIERKPIPAPRPGRKRKVAK